MKENLNSIPVVPCHIPELNIHCYGCCGNEFSSKEDILKDILQNTSELLDEGNDLNKEKLINFRDRFGGDNSLSETGLCFNLVDLDSDGSGCFGCPLHNLVGEILPNNSDIKIDVTDDLRIGHCDVNEECQTFSAWKNLTDEEKMDFIKWVKSKNYDSYNYSVENGSETLFEQFLFETGRI